MGSHEFSRNRKKSYGRVPMISGNGTEKLFTTRSEILGLAGVYNIIVQAKKRVRV